MRTGNAVRTGRGDTFAETDADDGYGTYEVFRVDCPECGQSIALLADEEFLPRHALCPTRWNPFGLTVCAGSGRSASEAAPTAGSEGTQEEDVAALLSLPAGLDWRRQPFSHIGGPETRPVRVPVPAGRG